jgi:hypothetical protein
MVSSKSESARPSSDGTSDGTQYFCSETLLLHISPILSSENRTPMRRQHLDRLRRYFSAPIDIGTDIDGEVVALLFHL